MTYDPEQDPVHGSGWNSAARWGGWSWREPRYGDHFRTCSFCGSIHPEDLASEQAGLGACIVCGRTGWEAHFREGLPKYPGAESEHPEHAYDPQGWYASWADQKYGWPHKFYVEGMKPRDPDLLHCLGHSTGGDGGKPSYQGNWVHASELTREQKKIIKADGMTVGGKLEGWYEFSPRATLHAKFYTAHLADSAISDEVKDLIGAVSGRYFKFDPDGHVYWAGTKEALEREGAEEDR